MGRFDYHVFVCTNERPPGTPLGSCCEKGSAVIFTRLKQAVEEHGLGYRVRVNQAGCLAACGFGPTVAVYPGGVWYGRVKPEDVPTIVTRHLMDGEPMESIRIPDDTWDIFREADEEPAEAKGADVAAPGAEAAAPAPEPGPAAAAAQVPPEPGPAAGAGS